MIQLVEGSTFKAGAPKADRCENRFHDCECLVLKRADAPPVLIHSTFTWIV